MTTNVTLHGKHFKADIETKATSEPFNNDEEIASVKFETLRGTIYQSPLKTMKEFGVKSQEFCKEFNDLFKEHNKKVDEHFLNLRSKTIETIERFCGEWSKDGRKKFVEEAFHKHIYDIRVGGNFIRFNEKMILFFDKDPLVNKKEGVGSMTEVNNPIMFNITEEEFNQLEKMFLNF